MAEKMIALIQMHSTSWNADQTVNWNRKNSTNHFHNSQPTDLFDKVGGLRQNAVGGAFMFCFQPETVQPRETLVKQPTNAKASKLVCSQAMICLLR